MKQKEIEVIKTQAEAMSVEIEIIYFDFNKYAVHVGNHSYIGFNKALSAVTTKFLKDSKW